jgi:hypothetical protein
MTKVKKFLADISSATTIPLGLAIATIGSGAFWLASLSARVEAASNTMVRHEATLNRAMDIAEKVDSRVANIEGFLGRLEKRFRSDE